MDTWNVSYESFFFNKIELGQATQFSCDLNRYEIQHFNQEPKLLKKYRQYDKIKTHG